MNMTYFCPYIKCIYERVYVYVCIFYLISLWDCYLVVFLAKASLITTRLTLYQLQLLLALQQQGDTHRE